MPDPAEEQPPGTARPLSVVLAGRSALALVALVVNGLCRVVAALVVGRVAGVVSLGIVQSGLAGAQLASLFGPAGYGSAASAFIPRSVAEGTPDQLASVHGHLLLRMLQTATLVVATSAVVWWLLPGDDLLGALAFALLTLSFCLYPFTRGLLYGAGLAARAATWNVATSLLGLVAVCVAVVAGAEGDLLLVVFSTGYLAYTLVNWQRAVPRRIRGALGREIDRFALLAVVGTVASAGFLNATMVAAGTVGDPTEVGHFGAAFALAIPSSLIGAAVSLVLFPMLSGLRSGADRSRRARAVDLSSRYMAVPVVALFAVLVLLRREIVSLLWGPDFLEAAGLLAPLLLAIMCTTLAIPAVNSLTALTEHGMRHSAVSSATGLTVGVLTWLAAVPQLGLLGVACGFLAGSVVSSTVPFVLTWRQTGQSWSGHALQLALAVGTLGALAAAQELYDVRTPLSVGLLAAFLLAWLLVSLPPLRALWGIARATLSR